ncbi:MAG TPA: aldolase/citrate lyase family protein [Chloroflexota bacterium]
MRVNTTKQKMLKGEPAFGYALGYGSPLVAEALGRCGIDFLLIDNQHGSFSAGSTLASLIAIEGGSATPMARVARNDYTKIGRLLDEGSLGIVVPMVHTVEEARAAVTACRFPPNGTRSWGWSHAGVYGADYPDWIDDQVFLAVQLESIQAVENAEAIMAVPGVDGCWVGPSDLALSMGVHPRDLLAHEGHQRALERVVEACRNTGKIPGISAFGIEDSLERAKKGYQFLVCSSDQEFLMNGALQGVETLRRGSRA